jgi:hypothetical protein
VLLGIVQFFERQPGVAGYVLSVIAVLLVLWAIIYVATRPKEEEKKGKK